MPLDEVEIFAKCYVEAWNASTQTLLWPNLAENDIPIIANIVRDAIKRRTELQLKDNHDEA